MQHFSFIDGSQSAEEASATLRREKMQSTDQINFLEAEIKRLGDIVTLRNQELEEKDQQIAEMEAYLINQEKVIRKQHKKVNSKTNDVRQNEEEVERLQEMNMILAKENLNIKARLISIEKALD